MANIKKSPESRKSEVLRIPLTPAQHSQIKDLHSETGMAEWARTVLLAQIALEVAAAKKPEKPRKTT